MTALDQAFIKAFAQQVPSSAAAARAKGDKIGTVAAVGSSNGVGQAPADVAAGTLTLGAPRLNRPRTPLPPLSASRGGVWAALEAPPKPAATPLPKEDLQAGVVEHSEKCETLVDDPHHDEEKGIDSAIAERPSKADEFTPAWRVQSFTWPKVCRQMLRQAGDQLHALADAVADANSGGKAVIAVAGCRRGEGATTLLLCVARQLAEQGIRTVVVDADRSRPVLAKRLGVQAQVGWDDGADSCDEAVVEAAVNRMALLPLKQLSGESEPSECDWTVLEASLRRLRGQFEVVLVDAGPLDELGLMDCDSAGSFARVIDGVLLVRNQRLTSTDDLGEVERQLASAGVTVVGIIENGVSERSNSMQKMAA